MLRHPSIPLLLMGLLVLAPGCRPQAAGEHHAEAEHGHPKADLPSRAVTVHTPKSELFAEHRFLVVGQEAAFAAHLTDLADFTPVSEGRLEAVLTAPSGQSQVFAAEGVERPGIFRPVAKPTAPGTYRLSFRLASPKLQDVIEAGEVVVYPDVASARAAEPDEEANPDEVPFLKEQQWKIPFETRVVRAGQLEESIALQGTVQPAGGREVAVVAPTSGRIALGARPQLGDRVSAGTLLAVLTPATDTMGDRATLTQAVSAAEATLNQARLELGRAERLQAAQAVPRKRVEEARTAVTIAESGLAAARQRLSAKRAALAGQATSSDESYRLRAPIAGTIVEAKVVPGSYVAEGAPLYRIVDLRQVWVEARVPEIDLNRLAGSKRAEITVPGGDTVTVGNGQGGLVTVGSVLDPATRTAPAVFSVPNPEGQFRIGMTADVRALTGPTRPAPVVPRSAVVDDNGRPIAYIQTGGESFERRELKLGVKQGEQVQVLAGLKPGDRIVTQGGYEIRLSTLSDSVPAHGHAH